MPPNEGPTFPPKDEPEIRRLKARRYAIKLNEETRRPTEMPLKPRDRVDSVCGARNPLMGLGPIRASGAPPTPEAVLAACPPSRFSWFVDQEGAVDECMKVRDDQTGRVAVWPVQV